jgi:hypothetical protein
MLRHCRKDTSRRYWESSSSSSFLRGPYESPESPDSPNRYRYYDSPDMGYESSSS